MNRICVIGDVMVDEWIMGEEDRRSEEQGEPILLNPPVVSKPGGAANVALQLQNLGAEVCLIGVIGVHGSSERALWAFQKEGLNTDYLRPCKDREMTKKVRVLDCQEHLVRYDFEMTKPINEEQEDELLKAFAASSLNDFFDAIVISDYNKGVCTPGIIKEMIAYGEKWGISVIADPKYDNWECYNGVTIFKPNRHEEEVAVRRNGFKIPECEYYITTRGSDGITVKIGDTFTNVPALPIDEVDSAGAGDLVTAVITLLFLETGGIWTAVQTANIVAARACEEPGICTTTREQIEEAGKECLKL